jgi:prepilin-type N-terminal cleavage/methylation domain-containing protein
MRNNKGFNLVELLIIIAIMGIVAALAAPNLNNLVRKNRIENQTRRIYTDLSNTRIRAMSTNRTHCLIFQPAPVNHYQVISDTNGNGQCDAAPADTEVLKRAGIDIVPFTFTNNVPPKETITDNLGGGVVFNGRGLARGFSPLGTTVCVTAANIQPARNCVVVSPTWIRMGRLPLGAQCNATNCDETIQQ